MPLCPLLQKSHGVRFEEAHVSYAERFEAVQGMYAERFEALQKITNDRFETLQQSVQGLTSPISLEQAALRTENGAIRDLVNKVQDEAIADSVRSSHRVQLCCTRSGGHTLPVEHTCHALTSVLRVDSNTVARAVRSTEPHDADQQCHQASRGSTCRKPGSPCVPELRGHEYDTQLLVPHASAHACCSTGRDS